MAYRDKKPAGWTPYAECRERSKQQAIKMFDAYQKLGTLQKVGDRYGVSRERVRQLLAKGKREGWFDYKPMPHLSALQEKYPKELATQILLGKKKSALTKAQKTYLHYRYRIKLTPLKVEEGKSKAKEEYLRLCLQKKKIINTTYFYKCPELTQLRGCIGRNWKSFADFKEEVFIAACRDIKTSRALWEIFKRALWEIFNKEQGRKEV